MRIGIVGAGYVSRYHARAVQTFSDAELVGIADPDQNRANEIASKFGISGVYRNLSEMLAQAHPEVIHILTPPSFHCALTMEALEAGCHVLVEKPMAASMEECDQMIAKAQEKRRVLSVNHSMSFDPMVPKALRLIAQGVCGDLIAVDYFRSSDYPPYSGGPMPATYREGGYPYRDLGVHGLYLLEKFLGPIHDVSTTYRSTGLDANLTFDEWRAIVFAQKGVGHVQLSWNVRPMMNELLIQGTCGTIRVDFNLQTITIRKTLPGPKIAQLVWGAIGSGFQQILGTLSTVVRFATGRLVPSPSIHYSVIAFHQALRQGVPPPVSAEEGRRIVHRVEQAACRADADKNQLRASSIPQCAARILITGAGGFLGSALRQRLEQRGEGLRLLVHRPRREVSQANVEVIAGDLGDPEFVDHAVAGSEIVYHVGAAMRGSAADFRRGTVVGTQNIIEACLRHGVKRLVYVSSLSVLDHAGHRADTKITEFSPLEPHPDLRGHYTQTKLEAENLVLAACREYGLPGVIVRPGQIFGPGAEHVAPSGVISLAGRWLVVGNGDRNLPLVFVEDVVDALVAAAEQDHVCGSIAHLVDPTPVTQREFIGYARRKLGDKVRALYVPPFLLYILASGLELLSKVLKRSVPLTRYRIASIRPLWPFDGSAAERILGWKPRTGTRKGIELTFG